MKFLLTLTLISLSFQASSADMKLPDYNWWTVTDIASKGLTKEKLFSEMDREFIKVDNSICSNRALMWNNDIKKSHDLDHAKIFIYYTKAEKTPIFAKRWWYHVTPVVNENGKLWVLDPAFPGKKTGVQTIGEWFRRISAFETCREIQGNETELLEYVFSGTQFPKETSYGKHDCYYKVVPHTIWIPRVFAQNLLGKDESGKPVRVERPEIDKEELFQACTEATTGKMGYAMGANKKICKEYVER